jgi:hypothetical protein
MTPECQKMSEYKVKMIIEGRSTQARIFANDAGAAARLAREQYKGCNVRVLETSRVR